MVYVRIFVKVIKVNCFGTNEVPFKFQEELMVRFQPQKRDLQFRVVRLIPLVRFVD